MQKQERIEHRNWTEDIICVLHLKKLLLSAFRLSIPASGLYSNWKQFKP